MNMPIIDKWKWNDIISAFIYLGLVVGFIMLGMKNGVMFDLNFTKEDSFQNNTAANDTDIDQGRSHGMSTNRTKVHTILF